MRRFLYPLNELAWVIFSCVALYSFIYDRTFWNFLVLIMANLMVHVCGLRGSLERLEVEAVRIRGSVDRLAVETAERVEPGDDDDGDVYAYNR